MSGCLERASDAQLDRTKKSVLLKTNSNLAEVKPSHSHVKTSNMHDLVMAATQLTADRSCTDLLTEEANRLIFKPGRR